MVTLTAAGQDIMPVGGLQLRSDTQNMYRTCNRHFMRIRIRARGRTRYRSRQ
jgi:hypothetical protein